MKKFSYVDLIGRLLPIGERAIVKMGRNRYIIYLPTQFNYLWRELQEKGIKARVYIEIVEHEE